MTVEGGGVLSVVSKNYYDYRGSGRAGLTKPFITGWFRLIDDHPKDQIIKLTNSKRG